MHSSFSWHILSAAIAATVHTVSSAENPNHSATRTDMNPEIQDGLFAAVLRMAGPILFMALQVSCIAVAIDIYRMKSVRKLSSVPFASLMANGVLWSAYGWLKQDNTIFVPNVVSIGTAAFCMFLYYKYALIKPLQVYGAAAVVSAVGCVLVSYGDAQAIGFIGCAMSIMMSGSPLAVIDTVIKEKSTASLPFWTSLVTWLNTLSWVLYGALIAHDNMIIVPNALGLLLATLQMALFVAYGCTPPAKAEDTATALTDPYESPYNV